MLILTSKGFSCLDFTKSSAWANKLVKAEANRVKLGYLQQLNATFNCVDFTLTMFVTVAMLG